MRVKREAKEDDQHNSQKAYHLLCDLINLNPDICDEIWIAGMWATIITSLKNSGYSYKEATEQIDEVKNHYKIMWNDGN